MVSTLAMGLDRFVGCVWFGFGPFRVGPWIQESQCHQKREVKTEEQNITRYQDLPTLSKTTL